MFQIAVMYAAVCVPIPNEIGYVETVRENCSRGHSAIVRQFIHTVRQSHSQMPLTQREN